MQAQEKEKEYQRLIDFIPVAKLKPAFEVFGHFYSVDLKSGERIECRSVLEIITKERCPAEQDSLLTQIPDAIFVMMNPGSSKPLEEVENIIPEELVGKLDISLVPTKPDITQYQVMRVTHCQRFRETRKDGLIGWLWKSSPDRISSVTSALLLELPL